MVAKKSICKLGRGVSAVNPDSCGTDEQCEAPKQITFEDHHGRYCDVSVLYDNGILSRDMLARRALRVLLSRLIHDLPLGVVEYYRSTHYHRPPRWQARLLVSVILSLPLEYTSDPRLAPVMDWARDSQKFFEIATEPRKAHPPAQANHEREAV